MNEFEQFRTKEEVIKYIRTTRDNTCRTNAQAEQYLRDHLPKESYYQKKIMDRIKELVPEAAVWKEAAGAYSQRGIPDVTAVINGRYYGFEVKRPFIGVLSKIQEQTIKKIQKAGGRAYVVSYPDEITRILTRHGEVSEADEKRRRI